MENAKEEMNFFNQFVDKGLIERLNHVLKSDFGHVTYTEAIEILEKHNEEFEYKVFWGCDLQTEHERFLTEKEFRSANAISGSIIQNSAACLVVLEFSARNVGPKVYTFCRQSTSVS